MAIAKETHIGNIRALSPQERSLNYLDALISEQRADYPSELFEDFRGRSKAGSGLLDAFVSSPFFMQVYAAASNRVNRFTDFGEYDNWLSGHLFSNLAWLALASNAPQDTTVLTENAVLDLIKESADVKIEKNEYGKEMIAGMYVPDGALTGEDRGRDRILTMFEYKLSLDFYTLLKQFVGFRHVRRELNGTCSDDTNLVFVIPETSTEVLRQIKEEIIRASRASETDAASLRFVSLPIPASDFSRFKDYVASGYENGELQRNMLDRAGLISGIDVPKYYRRQELGNRARRLFQNGANVEDDLIYVLNYGPRYELPMKAVKRAGVITLPRQSPASLGEPSMFTTDKS